MLSRVDSTPLIVDCVVYKLVRIGCGGVLVEVALSKRGIATVICQALREAISFPFIHTWSPDMTVALPSRSQNTLIECP